MYRTSLLRAICLLSFGLLPLGAEENPLALEPVLRKTGQAFLNGRPFDPDRASAMALGETAPAPTPLSAAIRLTNRHKDQKLTGTLRWRVTDFAAGVVHETAAGEWALGAQETEVVTCVAPPGAFPTPLLFHYESESGGRAFRGTVPAAQANAVIRVDDFDVAMRPLAGSVRLESEAAHSGRFGLQAEPTRGDAEMLDAVTALAKAADAGDLEACRSLVAVPARAQFVGSVPAILGDTKLAAPERLQRLRAEASRLPREFLNRQTTAIPIGAILEGQPVSLSVWVRPRKNGGWIEIDFGAVFVNDRPQHAWRVVGPALDWEGWREVTFDLPVYPAPNQPAAENDRKRDPDAQGPANYPMRLDAILLRGMASCAIDGITLRTWSGRKNPIQVLTWSSLPGNLVPPGDPIHVLVQNTSLHQPCDRLLRWQTVDLAFRPYARGEMRFHLPPGQSDALAVSTAGLPKGVFGLRIQVLEGEKVTYRNDWDEEMSRERLGQRFVVYRPALPETDLVHIQAHLRDGHAVEKELGKAEARVEMQWHNSYPEMRDGIQPREGLWQWHDYDARVRAGATAGKELVGRLGLTAAWASPVGRYDAFHNRDWVGSPFTPPMRSVDWERYVYTVVKRYRENVSLWEIWNEPDDPAFNMTAGEFCGKVLRVACQAARNADPNCKVLLGGISRERLLPFLGDFLKSGGHELVDAVGIHPVVDPMSPERAFLDDLLVEAQQMAEQAGAGGKLWITELGWNVGGRDDVSELEQAQYLARALVLARFAGIRRVLIDLHDSQWNEKSSGVLFQPRYEPRFIQYRLGALAFKQARSILGDSVEPVSEVCLRDRRYHLARAYLFRTAEDYVLAAWRESGTAAMPRVAEEAYDMVGNRLPPDRRDVELSPSPIYFHIPLCDSASLRRSLERLPLEYEDAEGSEWKRRLTCFVDVGDPADEAKSGYEVSGKTVIVTKSALYPNKRSLKDSGRVIHGTETFVVPVSDFGSQDLILCRRVDYNAASLGVKDQKCDVRVDGQQTGVWHVPGQDRVRSWRDTCFIVPNRFLVGHTTVKVSLTALDGPFTTFELVAGPMKPGIVYLSDWYPLVDTQGWIGQARADTSFIHSPITVHARKFLKGLGVHAPSQLVYGLNRQFRTFVFLPGVDDVTEGKGSVRFKVILDGRLAYDSQRVDAFAQIGPQETNVENVSLLQLIVEDGEDGKENDVADWCDARLTY